MNFCISNSNLIKMHDIQKGAHLLGFKSSYSYSYVCLCVCTNCKNQKASYLPFPLAAGQKNF